MGETLPARCPQSARLSGPRVPPAARPGPGLRVTTDTLHCLITILFGNTQCANQRPMGAGFCSCDLYGDELGGGGGAWGGIPAPYTLHTETGRVTLPPPFVRTVLTERACFPPHLPGLICFRVCPVGINHADGY